MSIFVHLAFCAALGNSVTDKCHPTPLSDEDCCTQTASLLQQSFLPLKKFLQLGSIGKSFARFNWLAFLQVVCNCLLAFIC